MRYMKWGTQPASASTHTSRSPGWRSNTPLKMNMPMMSWQPRMIDMNALIFGPRIRNVSCWLVRMWKLSGSPRSTAASHSGSYMGSS